MGGAGVHFCVNHFPDDGSAHALHCFRTVYWAAKAKPDARVYLHYPRRSGMSPSAAALHDHFQREPVGNLHLLPLSALRKRPVTLNTVFYRAAEQSIICNWQPGDVFVSASFDKLFRSLVPRLRARLPEFRAVYEIHQLVELSATPVPRAARAEHAAIAAADLIVTTTGVLEDRIKARHPGTPTARIGLFCGFDPEAFGANRPRNTVSPCHPFRVVYAGSVYREQGIVDVVRNWPAICAAAGQPLALQIVGRHSETLASERDALPASVRSSVTLAPACHGEAFVDLINGADAMLIPALAEGRMPHVAFSKAYDYPAFGKPIVASALPGILDVLEPAGACLPVQPGNWPELGAALGRLATDDGLRQRLAANARTLSRALQPAARASAWWDLVSP